MQHWYRWVKALCNPVLGRVTRNNINQATTIVGSYRWLVGWPGEEDPLISLRVFGVQAVEDVAGFLRCEQRQQERIVILVPALLWFSVPVQHQLLCREKGTAAELWAAFTTCLIFTLPLPFLMTIFTILTSPPFAWVRKSLSSGVAEATRHKAEKSNLGMRKRRRCQTELAVWTWDYTSGRQFDPLTDSDTVTHNLSN